MKLIGVCRIGRDVELRYLNDGTPVANLSGAWNYGKKQDGQQPTMWGSFSLWGNQAEKLAPWLLKGKAVFLVVGDVHIETYEGRDGSSGHKLVGRVESLEFAGGRSEDGGQRGGGDGGGAGQAHAPAAGPAVHQVRPNQQNGYRNSGGRPAPGGAAPAPRPAPGGASSGFDDMDDDIPFVSMHAGHDPILGGSKLRRARAGR